MVAQPDSAHFGRMASLYFHMAGATYRDTLGARLIMEPVVAGIIAEQQDPEHIETLKAFIQESEAASSAAPSGDTKLTLEQEIEAEAFHSMLMDMSGNPVISLLARSLQGLRRDPSSGPIFTTEDQQHVGDIHTLIARAIIDGRPAQAEQLMREHMREQADLALQRYPAILEQTVSWH
jgi:DNA-binding FadR family transcriptional regulator